MGQYYSVYTKNGNDELVWSMQSSGYHKCKDMMDGEEKGFYYIGVKLMEHSWIGNQLTNAVSTHIYQNPTVVAWVGDYTNEDNEFYKKAYAEDVEEYYFDVVPMFDYEGKYLVNHTKKIAMSFDGVLDNDGWKIYPVSLLTATSNGAGGGDYWGKNNDLCGEWAGDLISIEDTIPEGYTEETMPGFIEQ